MDELRKNVAVSDPLGLNQFALTESAYDLITSLTGIYSRLLFHESKQTSPNPEDIAFWEKRILDLRALYYHADWSDLEFLNQLISTLAIEYKQASQNESDYMSHTPNVTHPRPEQVSPV